MRIRSIELRPLSIPFRVPFRHALVERRKADTIVVTAQSEDGVRGFGEILPRPYLTGETIEAVLREIGPALVRPWIGRPLDSWDEVVAALRRTIDRAGRALAAFAGLELAVLDLAGRVFGRPAGDVLGEPHGRPVPPGAVIGFEIPTETLAERCAVLRRAGRRHLKVKVGRSDDLRRLEIVTRVFGPDVPLRLDANGAWTAAQAIATLQAMRCFHIDSIEQPVPANDLSGLREVRERTGVRVTADESLCTLEDAERLIEARAADVFNVRLAKCGGFTGSSRLVALAKRDGLRCHLGTLVGETAILSRASEIFASRVEGFDCLEGKGQNRFLLAGDVAEPGRPHRERREPPWGLGVDVSPSRLEQFAVPSPVCFWSRISEGVVH